MKREIQMVMLNFQRTGQNTTSNNQTENELVYALL